MIKFACLPIAAAAVLIGCQSGSPGSASSASNGAKTLTVGFAQEGAESAWRTAETQSIKDEAAKRGIKLQFSDGQQDQTKQIAAMHNFITQRVDAIILAPKVETGWDQVLKEAQAAKIPVILVDRGVSADKDLYVTLIASDFVEEGKRAAEKMFDLLDKRYRTMNRLVNIVELEGTIGAAPAIDRKKGFDEEMAKYPQYRIVLSQSGDFNRAKGQEVMEAFLKSGKPIDAVYAHNDDMAIGAIQAIAAAGKKPGQDIVIVSIDGIKDALQAVADGKSNAVIECNPLLGPAAFDAVEKAIKGQAQPKWIKSEDHEFDASNAAQALPTRKY